MFLRKIAIAIAAFVMINVSGQSEPVDFYYYLVGNWRNGPEVLITPPIAGDESRSMEQLQADAVSVYEKLDGIKDIDVVIEPDEETAWNSIKVLRMKYAKRELSVLLLEYDKE